MEDLLEGARESREGGIESSGSVLRIHSFMRHPQAKREEEKVEDNLKIWRIWKGLRTSCVTSAAALGVGGGAMRMQQGCQVWEKRK